MKGRTFAISLVVAMAVGMMVAGFYGSSVMDESVERLFEDQKMADLFVEFSESRNVTELDPILGSSADVDEYMLRLRVEATYGQDEVMHVLLVGIQDTSRWEVNKLEMVEGELFSDTGEAVAVSGLEDKGIEAGKRLTFDIAGTSVNVTLTGIVRSPEFIFTSAYEEFTIPMAQSLIIVFMDLEELQTVAGPGVNEAVILMNDGGSEESVLVALEPLGVDSVTYKDSHSSVMFMKIGSTKMKNMFPLMGVVFLIIGFISIFMTMIRLVQTDSRYIGVLMSLGYEKREIVRSYLVFGLVLGAIGSALGMLFAVGFTYLFVDTGMSLYFSLDIVFPFDPMPFLGGIAFAFATVLVSVWVPVLIITRASIREALDYKPRMRVFASRSVAGRMSKMTLYGLRNVVRNPGRMAITVIVVGLTLASAGMWLVTMDSAVAYLNEQAESDTWDILMDFNAPVETANVTTTYLNLGPGEATYVIPVRSLNVQAKANGEQVGAGLMGATEIERINTYPLQEGEADFSGAVVNGKLATDLDLSPGDSMVVSIGNKSVTLEVTGILSTGLSPAAYTHRSNLGPLSPPNESKGVFIQLADPDTAYDTARKIRKNPDVSSVIVHDEIVKDIEDVMDMALGFLGGFFFMTALITIVVAGSAVIISTMERDVEFATLDTLGIKRSKVASSIAIEVGIMGLLASALAIPLSFVLGKALLYVLREVLFYFPVVLAVGAAITIFVVGVAFVEISSIMPIRYSGKLDTDRTIRERTAG